MTRRCRAVRQERAFELNCVLAIAFAELDRQQEARTAVENILRIEPKYSLRTFAESQPFRDTDVLDRHVEGLRKAALPG